MNTKLAKRSICAIALGGWMALASALSIGELSGSAAVGRPLAVTAPIQLDEPAQGNSPGCVSAEVLYGDQRLDSSRVQIDLQPDATRQVSWARITSAAVVDEPFVTLVLRAGCGRATSRRFVLLADAPRDQPVALGAASTLAARSEPVAAAKPRVRAAAPAPAQSARIGAAGAARDPRPQGGRLQLAVWDPAQPVPWLRASAELKSLPSADAAQRAAATALWRALNAQPQDLLRTAERLRGLEAELGSLRSLADRHRSEILSARDSLQGAQRQRHVNLLVAILLALVAGSAAAFFWHRRRRAGAPAAAADSWYAPPEPWSGGDEVVQEEPRPVVGEPVAATAAQPAVVYREAVPMPRPDAPRPNAPRPDAPRPVLAPFAFTLPEASAPLPPVLFHDPGGLKVDALHGAQQQAEFFASLGQVDEAVSVLTSYLEESSEQPVLAYLELFRIYHGAGMRVEYEALQTTFHQVFGMDVASFGQYQEEHRELELYPAPVTRIASAWPSERSQEIIEELLFKRPATPGDLLSLDACRELLWLYSLGQEIVHSARAPAGLQLRGDRGLPNDHVNLPWTVGESDGQSELSLDRLSTIDVAPESDAFALDIDLNSMRGEPTQPAALEPARGPAPPPPPAIVPSVTDATDAFDAVMESESRRHHR